MNIRMQSCTEIRHFVFDQKPGLMNMYTYLQRVAFLAFLFSSFSNFLFSQCGQTDGTIIVRSAADEGIGTLRDAINCANLMDGPNRIIFQIPSTDRVVIQVGSMSGEPLPSLVNAETIIDGTTQTGFGTNDNFEPQIILDGAVPVWSAPINALKIFGDRVEIYGLEIRNFPDDGIDIDGANNVIIGDEEKGNVIYNCGIAQDFFPETGNQGPFDGVGILINNDADSAQILNNRIGTNYNNAPNLGNEWAGIYCRDGSDFALIEGNRITDNEIGIRIRNSFAIRISENNLTCNSVEGIQFVDGGNDDKAAPTISNATSSRINGLGNARDEIEVYIATDCADAPCQGSRFLGRTTVLDNGSWILDAPFVLDLTGEETITATASDNNNRTSRFAACQTAILANNCADENGIIWVLNANDEGDGSLRAAIECANETPGPNTIQFNIAGAGRKQINVGATSGEPLPFLRDAGTTIDGTTQAGFGENDNFEPQIILDGSSHEWRFPHNALWIRADNCAIYGLEIRNFPDDGIDITGGDFNIIGGPNKGNVLYNCGAEKDIFEDDPNQQIYNGCAIVLKSGVTNSIVQGNIIGTNYEQTLTVGNELCGIILQRDGIDNRIGGTAEGEGNIIAYHPIGIHLQSTSFNNQILGNRFYCNENSGISLNSGANNNQITPTINIASIDVINGTGTNGDTIEIYTTSNACPETACQGNLLIGRTTVVNNSWRLEAPYLDGIVLNGTEQVAATATSTTGNTSAFSACVNVGGIDPPPPNCTINLSISNFHNETCVGNDGSFTLSSDNAVQPITFSYGEDSTQSPVFSNLNAGIYNVTATDANNCSATLTIIISQEPTPTLSVVATTNENCGAADGSFTVAATDGQSPYIYELDNGRISRTPTFSNLVAGDYIVSVIDANNCVATQPVTIQKTGNINVAIADMRNDNCNNASGSFRIAASGGLAPYSFDLGNGAVNNNQFSGLSAGDYAVTVTDANNCSTIANITISGGTAPVTAIENVVQTNCNQSTGAVIIAVSGGLAPFQYNIGNGNVLSPEFSDLAVGNYTITVTDANNCTATQAITINEPSHPALSIVASQNATCGNANGSITVLSNGGQAPYTFDIGRGRSATPNFSNLAEGNYTVTVYDANNCTDEMAVIINNSPIPTLTVANVQDASCNLANAILTVEGTGTPPLRYDIGEGPTESPIFSDLFPGNYTVTLTDGNNCVASTTIEINSTGGPQVNVQNTSEARCDRANGEITVFAFGGFPPYTYDIGNGPSENPTFSDLAGGNYVVTLTDDNGCTATQSISLGNIPAPTFGIGNIVDASCGEANGSFNVSAFGGLAPYQFSIGNGSSDNPNFTNLSAGNYTVVVTDANNCVTALGVTVEGTAPPIIEIAQQQNASCGQTDGSFELHVSGGIAPYFFDIGNGESTNSTFQNLSPGAYTVTVTDASNCSQIQPVAIEGSGTINVAITKQLPAACGNDNGTFTVSPSGGQAPYNFVLNGQSYGDSTFSNLASGNYELKTIDANGCSATENIEIEGSNSPELEVEILTNCGDQSAIINVAASQGQAPYIFDIGLGPTTSTTFRGITPGLHQVKVVDATGCERTKNIAVNISNEEPEATITVLQQPNCNTDNGSIQINVTKGRPPYVYALSDTAISPFPTFDQLSTGNYAFTVTDAGGCQTTLPLSLGVEDGGPTAGFTLSVNELDGMFTNFTQDATNYRWDFGDGNTATTENAQHTFANSGTYTICLTATNDCGEDTYCENYTIEALNTNQSFEFDFGEINGSVGEIVKIPVYVNYFRSVVGFQKSVHLEDPSVAKIIGISDIALKDLAVSLFNIKDDQYSMTWFDGAIAGFDLPDSTIIYQIEVELLKDNACTNILLNDNPLPTQVYKKVNNSEVEVEFFKRTGKICSGNSETGTQTFNISGSIHTEDGMNISDVTLSCTNTSDQLNEKDGTYLFSDLLSPNSYKITPSKNVHPINGITTFDLVIIQNHVLGNEYLDSPYKIIAADVNNSGTVTVSDILELRKLLLLNISDFSNNESWRFVPTAYEFENPANPLAEDYPTSMTLVVNTKSLTADFIGIKIGDVNNTATPNEFINTLERTKPSDNFIISLENQFLEKGKEYDLTFAANELDALLGLQFTLGFETSHFAVQSLQPHTSFKQNHFGQKMLNKGFLLTSWTPNNTVNSNEKTALFTLKVSAKQSGALSDLVQFSNDFLIPEAYYKDGSVRKVQLQILDKTPNTSADFVLKQNQPNPFAENTVIHYQLPNKGTVRFTIFDIQGKRIRSFSTVGTAGWNQINVHRSDLPKGSVFYYQLTTPFGQATRKMIGL